MERIHYKFKILFLKLKKKKYMRSHMEEWIQVCINDLFDYLIFGEWS